MDRRPMSAYSGLQMPQQRSQQQKGLAPVARSSSMRVSGAQAGGQSAGALPIPQRTKSDTKGPSTPTGIARPMGLPLAGPKRQQNDVADNPEDMERIFSEANAIAKRLSSSAVQSRSGAPGLRAPGVKGEPVVVVVRKAGLPSPTGVPVPGGQQVKSRLSAPPRAVPPNAAQGLKQRLSHPGTVAGVQRQDPRQIPQPQGLLLPRPPGAQGVVQVRRLVALQPRSQSVNQSSTDNSIAAATAEPMSESESARTIRELNEELERWKIEAEEHRQERERWRRESEEHRQERASVEVWQKQISNLERDLEVALFSLQSAEAKVIETKGDQEAVSIKFSEYEKTIETMKADLEDQKSTQEKAQEETTISHGIKVEGLEARNKELEKRLEQAQHEIDQLELQVVPAELQDIHQALFTANQNLEETKRKNEKLTADLAEANANVTRAQEDSSELLSKVSQLQDTIATHIRDNNTLKESLKEHGKCQENVEAISLQHTKDLESLQAEITAQHQQVLAQERDQKLRL
ncbi:hypothetical protein B0O80DRAFT_94673 [Mortierella sp. GBAus27b]|nr:hypothetical protein B0O80DRAFT_94673 [Mortierella sp. GBAus27b]